MRKLFAILRTRLKRARHGTFLHHWSVLSLLWNPGVHHSFKKPPPASQSLLQTFQYITSLYTLFHVRCTPQHPHVYVFTWDASHNILTCTSQTTSVITMASCFKQAIPKYRNEIQQTRLAAGAMSPATLTFSHRSFTFNSNKSPTQCNNFSVYYPDVCLQLNTFREFSRPSSGA